MKLSNIGDYQKDPVIAWSKFSRPWPLRGFHGQVVGEVTGCAVNFSTGRIVLVELSTRWQTLPIPWRRVALDGDACGMRLVDDRQ